MRKKIIMGMYTEIYINCSFKKEIPQDVIKIIKYLFDNEDVNIKGENLNIPSHEFFSCPRWTHIGNDSSYYHIPFYTSNFKFDDISQQYYLTSRSDLKNYEREIENFFDWVMPYIDEDEGQFIGYHRYECDQHPILIYKE